MARRKHSLQQPIGFVEKLKSRRRIKAARLRRRSLSEGLMRQPFEKLEDRHLLAVVQWDGGGDGQSWHDPLNWDGDTIPAAIDHAVIEDASTELIVQIDLNVEVASINSTESLEVLNAELRTDALMAHELILENGTLNPLDFGSQQSVDLTGDLTIREDTLTEGPATQFLVLGNIQVAGDLNTYRGLTITALGSDAALTIQGDAPLQGVDLSAFGGGVLSFPGVTEFQHDSRFRDEDLDYNAEGAGSRIEFDNLLTLGAGDQEGADMRINAREGGVISMANLTTIMDPIRTDTDFRSVRFIANGIDSQIDLSSLVSVHNRDRDEVSYFIEQVGGDILLGSLESVVGWDLTLGEDPATINNDLSSLQHLESSVVRLSNDQFDAPALARFTVSTLYATDSATFTASTLDDFFGSSLFASTGGQISFPALTQYSSWTTGSSQVRRFQASGVGSSISMASLESVVGGDDYNAQLYFEAFDGALLDLPALVSLDDPDRGDKRLRRFGLNASGPGSILSVPSLTTIRDYRSGSATNEHSSVAATEGGIVFAPQLSRLRGVNLLLNSESTLTPEQLQSGVI
ncbi:MAG: hypothetical protein AAFU85_33150, partial [Planctomycetota bacterium]